MLWKYTYHLLEPVKDLNLIPVAVHRRYVRTGRCPLVFIVSDSLSGDRGSRLLFPKEVQDELAVSNIR